MKGVVTFSAEDQQYSLHYTMNAICALEEAADRPFTDFLSELEGAGLSMRALRQLIWAGLTEFHPGISEMEAGEIATALGVPQMVVQIEKALKAAFPDNKKGKDAGKK